MLVVAFGLGMALVMGGIGLALVLARGRLDRSTAGSPLGRVERLRAARRGVLVFGLGLYLTVQAVAGTPRSDAGRRDSAGRAHQTAPD